MSGVSARRSSLPLDYILSLAEAALVEMRALIFEMRPESLETEGLVSALSKSAIYARAHHKPGRDVPDREYTGRWNSHLCVYPRL